MDLTNISRYQARGEETPEVFYHNIGDIRHYKYIFTRVEYDHSELHSLGTILDDDNEAAER